MDLPAAGMGAALAGIIVADPPLSSPPRVRPPQTGHAAPLNVRREPAPRSWLATRPGVGD